VAKITISVPDELKARMDKAQDINYSALFRDAVIDELDAMAAIPEMLQPIFESIREAYEISNDRGRRCMVRAIKKFMATLTSN